MSPIVVTNSSPSGRVKRVKAATASGVTPFFSDDFAGGVINNANGFTWNTPNGDRTAINTENPYPGTTHSLCFRFGPTALDSLGEQNTAEQRFSFGRDISEFWLDYYLHVPSNFAHRTNASTSDNNKLIILWKNSAASASTFRSGVEFLPATAAPEDRTKERCIARLANTFVEDISGYNLLWGSTGPGIIGDWNHIQMHWRMSDPYDATNGLFRLIVNDTVLTNATGYVFNDLLTTDRAVVNGGYFMGASNSGYTLETKFYIAKPMFYDTDPGW